MERKLASIRKIELIEEIPNKDKIVLAHLDGWQAIIQKDAFKVNDLVVYFEVDSFLPIQEQYEFLRSRCFKSTKNLGDGFRIRSMKMGGILSQGLVLPIPEDTIKGLGSQLEVGLDLTEHLCVQKYEKPIPACLRGKVRGNFPSFIPKTDQERVQNCFRTLETKWIDYTWEQSLKLDGSSMTMYCNLEKSDDPTNGIVYQWVEGVCSRNLNIKTDDNDGNLFVEMWRQLHGSIYHYCVSNDTSLAFQGELMGSGIQGNREQLPNHTFYCFDVFNITTQKYLTSFDRIELCKNLNIQTVPILGYIKFEQDLTIKNLLKLSDTPSINNKVAEGIVYKSVENPEVSFKVINNKFLLQEED